MTKSTSVGELVRSYADKGAEGRVKRVFRRSAYLESKEGLILLLRGGPRSPVTVNIAPGPDLQEALTVGQAYGLNPAELELGKVNVRIDGAATFRSSLMVGRRVRPIGEEEIAKSATALKLLYSASESPFDLVNGAAFGEFEKSVLGPLSRGRTEQLYRFRGYSGMIGSGTGFTPAGDDFVAGFTAAFNNYARRSGVRTISLPLAELKRRTVSESASLVDYAQRGYADEELEGLVLAGLGDQPRRFRSHLSELASRGHTSGLDMSLGVLLSLAGVSDLKRKGRAVSKSIDALVG